MTFIVTGLSASGPAPIGCDSEVDALEKAAELIRAGFADVLIADGAGAQYTPGQFPRAFHL
jgi:3-oxoacyl-(acyl-carrier-protein) synthase